MALPSGYKRLAYIQGTGTQYINTGVSGRNFEIVVDFEKTGNKDSGNIIVGITNNNTSTYRAEILGDTSYQGIRMWNGISGDSVFMPTTLHLNERKKITITQTDSSLSVTDGISTITQNVTTATTNYLYLLSYYGATRIYGLFKIYSAQIKVQGTLVRDLIPVMRISDGVIGMYDLVNDTMYTNAGSGTFGYAYMLEGEDYIDIIPKMTSTSAPSGSITSSSTYRDYRGASYNYSAFDKVNATTNTTNVQYISENQSGGYIRYNFPSNVRLHKISAWLNGYGKIFNYSLSAENTNQSFVLASGNLPQSSSTGVEEFNEYTGEDENGVIASYVQMKSTTTKVSNTNIFIGELYAYRKVKSTISPVNSGLIQYSVSSSAITLTAVASSGYAFKHWENSEGEIVSTNVSYTLTTDETDDEITAVFVPVWEFAYVGEVETFIVENKGIYKLEVFGGRGGGNSAATGYGGQGGYAVGYKLLDIDEVLYIACGGAWNTTYNGGGNGNGTSYSGNGGGATHIATVDGLLSEVGSDYAYILNTSNLSVYGASNNWFQVTFEQPSIITQYAGNNASDGSYSRSWDMTIKGSNDGTNWVDIQTNSMTATGTNTIDVNNSTPYLYYRWYFSRYNNTHESGRYIFSNIQINIDTSELADKLLIVAGGGGGGAESDEGGTTKYGGTGGGTFGGNASGGNWNGYGGRQYPLNIGYAGQSNQASHPEVIGTFGQGGSAESGRTSGSYYAGGGGGGYYGGGGGGWSTDKNNGGPGGGGSGYIGGVPEISFNDTLYSPSMTNGGNSNYGYAKITLLEMIPLYEITLTYNNSFGEATYSWKNSQEIRLTASVNATAQFLGWYVNNTLIGSTTTLDYVVNADVEIEARFEKIYDITSIISGPGTITYERDETDKNLVTFRAHPNVACRFIKYVFEYENISVSESLVSPTQLRLIDDLIVTAYFEEYFYCIYDRTIPDVNRVKELNHKLQINTYTPEEMLEWKSLLKGAINRDDLERINENIQFLALKLDVAITIQTIPEIPTAEWYATLLENVQMLEEAWMVYDTTPNLPSQDINDYIKWNAIERILFDIYSILSAALEYHCGIDLIAEDNIII